MQCQLSYCLSYYAMGFHLQKDVPSSVMQSREGSLGNSVAGQTSPAQFLPCKKVWNHPMLLFKAVEEKQFLIIPCGIAHETS